jgi:hypothetical protein
MVRETAPSCCAQRGDDKTPSSLQDLSASLYDKAKTEPTKRFWGLYVHVCRIETLQEAYEMAKKNNGAPGIDGVTFEAIEESGAESFQQRIRDELITNTYRPRRARKMGIPRDGEKLRILSIPSIRDRVVQGALKLILEPIFEADFEGLGSDGNLYGTTIDAEVEKITSLFRVTPAGQFTVLQTVHYGQFLVTAPIQSENGNLYAGLDFVVHCRRRHCQLHARRRAAPANRFWRLPPHASE